MINQKIEFPQIEFRSLTSNQRNFIMRSDDALLVALAFRDLAAVEAKVATAYPMFLGFFAGIANRGTSMYRLRKTD